MTSTRTARGPLAGLKVMELGGIGPVPFTGMVLADWGADVVRVDRPDAAIDPNMALPARFSLMNRGRRSIGIDLSRPEGTARATELAAVADVLLEGFRPGVTERLGLGPDVLLPVNPRLVYARQTGWGQTGPLAQRAGHDIDYIARTGALNGIGPHGAAPVVPLNLIGDFAGGGLLMAAAILAALHERSFSGRGQVIDAAMAEGANLMMTMFHGLMAAGQWTDDRGVNLIDGGEPFYDTYRTADDRYLAVGPLENRFFETLCAALGVSADRSDTSPAARAALRATLADRFATRTQAEWESVFDSLDACVAPVRNLREAPTDPHLSAREAFVTVDGIVQPAPAPLFSRTPAEISGPPATPGADGDAIVSDWLGKLPTPDGSALAGLRVVELCGGIAGPGAGMFLAAFGAEVVKIETGDGDPARALAGFQMWNRGKSSVLVDPANAAQRADVRALLESADVVICQDIPRTKVEFGIDLVAAQAVSPALTVLEVPPWQGPAPWLGGEESAELLSAAVGLAINQCSFSGGPVDLVEPQILYVQSAWAAAALAAALFRRQLTGWGETVTVTGAHAFAEFAPHLLVFDPYSPIGTRAFGPGGPNPTYTAYSASDGKWFFVGALPDKFRRRIFNLVHANDVLDDPRINQDTDRIFHPDNNEWVRERLAAGFLTRDRAHWLEKIEELDVPVAPLLDPDEWFDHPHLAAMGGRAALEHPRLGHIDLPAIPITMLGTPAADTSAAPELGAHRLADISWPARPRPTGPRPEPSADGPLAGIRVISLGAYVAGPYSARLLGELGAEVVKIEPAEGDPWRTHGFQVNDGMLGMALDIRTPEGVEVLRTLVRRSDIVIDNFRPGVSTRLGIDHEQLTALKPDIITVSITGFGEKGPMSHRPGFDPVLGALSGMQSVQGGADEPVVMSLAVNDTGTAALSAVGALVALLARQKTGRGQHISCSLAATATYLQNGSLVRYPGRGEIRRGGRDFRGVPPFEHFYRTADGWVRIQSDRDTLDQIVATRLGVDPTDYSADPMTAISIALATHTSAEVASALNSVGIRNTPVRTSRDLAFDPVFAGVNVAHRMELSDGYRYLTLGQLANFAGRLPFGPMRPPGLGEHTVFVLRDIGLCDAEIDDLLDRGIAHQGEPMMPRVLTQYR